jgi:hypothetical protein
MGEEGTWWLRKGVCTSNAGVVGWLGEDGWAKGLGLGLVGIAAVGEQ